MVSGGADVMGVPWEIIIKSFREKLKTDRFDTINEYCEEFFHFVDQFPFAPEAEEHHIRSIAYFVFSEIINQLDTWVENDELPQKGNVTETEIILRLQSQIEDASLFYAQQSDINGILDNDALLQVHDKYREVSDAIWKIKPVKHGLFVICHGNGIFWCFCWVRVVAGAVRCWRA